MSRLERWYPIAACALAPILWATAPLQAQTALFVSGGPAEYDLSGTGWSGVVGAHVEYALTPWLRAQAGSGLFWYRSQGDTDFMTLLPELGLTAQASGPVPVYFGVGVGHTLGVRGDQDDDPTLHGALGLSLDVGRGWTVRPEMRVRSIDPWVGMIAGFTLGVGRTLGG